MNVTTAGPGRPAQVPGEAATAAQVRRARLRAAVSARGIPLATILVAVAVVVLSYLAGKACCWWRWPRASSAYCRGWAG